MTARGHTHSLLGRWYHSHEEDELDDVVFRRADFEFPLTRAPRTSITIAADGTVTFHLPGETERSVEEPGDLTEHAGRARLRAASGVEYEVRNVGADVLVLRRTERRHTDAQQEDPDADRR